VWIWKKHKWADYVLAGVIVVTVPFAIPALLVAAYFTWKKEDGINNPRRLRCPSPT